MHFKDRADAGRALAAAVAERVGDEHPVVLGIARGGLAVAREVAAAVGAELDVVVVPKAGEADGERHARAERAYRRGARPAALRGATAVLVDDGMVTGRTAEAAIERVRHRGPARLVLALPVAADDACWKIAPLVDELICLDRPVEFLALKVHYDALPELDEDEAVALLRTAPPAPRRADRPLSDLVRRHYGRLERGLEAVRDALASGHAAVAARILARWRIDLCRHFDWEEHSVLGAYAVQCRSSHEAVAAAHTDIHRSLSELAGELGTVLAAAHGPETHVDRMCLLESLERKFAAHRDRELMALCAVLDSALPEAALRQLERALESR